MDLLFETQSGSTFSIEVGYWDTVLEIKQKIEKYQGHPVSEQTLFFNGKALKDDLDIEQCEIFDNSRLQLLTSPICKPNQKSTGDTIYGQDLPVTTEDIINDRQDSLVMERSNNSNEQVLQTEQPPPSNSTEQIINGQDLPQVLQSEKSPPSNSVKEIINIQDSHVKKRKSNEKATKSNKNDPTSKAIIKNPDSSKKVKGGPKRITVWVLPYSGESKAATKILVAVSPRDNVEELRKNLVKLQESDRLSLPQEAYYFIHKENKLVEDQSFLWNQVNHGDTIEISLGSVTSGSVTSGS